MKTFSTHFQTVDPVLAQALSQLDELPLLEKKGSGSDYFTGLCASIISQQLSTKVADVIWSRFVHLFEAGKDWKKGETEPTLSPEEVLEIPDQTLRDQGLSWAKIKYVKDLASKVHAKEIDLEHLDTLENEEVIAELTKVKGIGRWTAEMFLMFSLAREDVFSTGDLGLKRAIQKLYMLADEPTEEELLNISSVWKPYRTYAARILWKTLDAPKKSA